MKRLILSTMLAILLLFTGSAWFVLNTQWGLDRVHELVVRSVPGTLQIQSLQGTLRGPIRLFGLSYTHKGIDVKLERLEFDWRLSRLLSGILHITALDAHGLNIKQVATPTQQQTVTATPSVALPIGLDILQARLTHLYISTPAAQAPIVIRQIKLQASSRDSTVQLALLTIESDLFDLTTSGTFGLGISERLDLETDWTLRYPDYPSLSGRGRFNGTLIKLALFQTIQQPGLDISLQGQLQNILERVKWQLSLNVKRLDVQQLDAAWPDISVQGSCTSEGQPTDFTLAGNLHSRVPEQGSFRSSFELEAQSQIWTLTRFTTIHQPTEASFYARGEWRPGPELGDLTLTGGWNQLRLPLLAPNKAAHRLYSQEGKFELHGKPNAYRFNIKTDLAGPQLPATQLAINGHGNQHQVKLPDITARTLEGKLLGSAIVQWKPHLSWQSALAIHDVNPASQWRDWPGKLNGEFVVSRSGTADNPQDILHLKKLAGNLRGYPLIAQGKVSRNNRQLEFTDIDFKLGESRLQVSGLRGNDWSLQASLTSPDVNNLWPYSRGSLAVHANITGPRMTPHIIAGINAKNLAVNDFRISAMKGEFDIDLQSDEQFVAGLTVENIAHGGREWQSLVLRTKGARSQHTINLDLKQETGFIQLAIVAGLNQQQIWNGRIIRTTIDLKELGKWQQPQTAAFSVGLQHAELESWCLTQPAARFCIQAEHRKDRSTATLAAQNLSLDLLENWAPSHLDFQGAADLNASVEYRPGRQLFADLKLSISQGFHLKVADRQEILRFGTSKLQASLNKAGLASSLELQAGDLADLALHLNLPDWNALNGLYPTQPLTGQFKASVASLAVLNGVFLDSPELTGSLKIDLSLAGSLGAPLVIGETIIKQASVEIPALGIQLHDIDLQAGSKSGKQFDYRISARSGKTQPLTLTGYTLLDNSAGWPTTINVRADDFQLTNLPDVKMHISPDLEIRIAGRKVDLQGQVTIPQALFRPRTLPRTTVAVSNDVVYIGETTPQVVERWKTTSRIRLILGDNVYFDGFGLRGELSGNLLLIDEPGKLTLGQGEISITEGTYKAYGQDAIIRRGRLIFSNTVIDNPAIDLEAVREIDTVIAGVRVTGTLKQPELTLFSEPAMSESDIASYFLLGRPLTTTEDSEGQQLQQALLAARLAGGELLIDQTGIYSFVDEVSFETDKKTEQTSLVVGKYLSPKLYVRYVTGVVESSNIVEVHYKLKRYLRIQTETGYRGSRSVAGADIYYTIEH